jgi:antitoxin component YwqK of YwqJK toxin-antitoxin module
MRYLIYLLFLTLGLNSCTRSRVVITEEEIPEEVFYLSEQIKPFSGLCIINYTGTKIVKEEMYFEKGILNGPMTSYYLNGNIRRKGEFNNGLMEGKWESWYQDGKKQYIATYSNDSLDGEFVEWYSTGVMKEKGLYTQNKPVGDWVEYDEAGMILRKEQYE